MFNKEQHKSYHRLDLRADYATTIAGYPANVFFEVLNVYGNRTIQEFEYNKAYTDYEKDYLFPDGPLPSIGINISF